MNSINFRRLRKISLGLRERRGFVKLVSSREWRYFENSKYLSFRFFYL